MKGGYDMRYVRKPENFAEPIKNNLVIGYYHGRAIVKDELDKLYFIRCEEKHAPIGTVVDDRLLEPIEKLSSEECDQILQIYKPD